jgi:hypothetical protein
LPSGPLAADGHVCDRENVIGQGSVENFVELQHCGNEFRNSEEKVQFGFYFFIFLQTKYF